MPAVIRRGAAKRDLLRHFVYLAEHASLEVADHFIDAARTSFRQVSEMPLMGAPSGILTAVRDFRKYLILYRPIANGLQIDRVIHASVDYRRV